MIDRNQVHEGMAVRSSDGTALGRVLLCREGSFVVEKGFFARDYVVRYEDVAASSGGELRLSLPGGALPRGERAFAREGGQGESFTSEMGSELARDAGEEDDEVRPRERAATSGYELGAEPPTHGDEGGGGLL